MVFIPSQLSVPVKNGKKPLAKSKREIEKKDNAVDKRMYL